VKKQNKNCQNSKKISSKFEINEENIKIKKFFLEDFIRIVEILYKIKVDSTLKKDNQHRRARHIRLEALCRCL